MSNNPSFVLRKIEDVTYEERPIPDSTSLPVGIKDVAPRAHVCVKSRMMRFSSQ